MTTQLSQIPVGRMPEPNPLRLHPYLWDMRCNALIWRALRKCKKPAIKEEAANALNVARTMRGFHTTMIVRRAGA